MYKVFIYDRPVYLCNHWPENELDEDEMLLVEVQQPSDIELVFTSLEDNSSLKAVFMVSPDIEEHWSEYAKKFQNIQAAGGLVFNHNRDLLFIFRRGCWDLPKGKLDPGETIEQAAIREVEEECGISGVQLRSKLLTMHHTYPHKGKMVLKETHWFEMSFEGIDFQPEAEEQITEVSWIAKSDFPKILANTYMSIAEIVSKVS